MSGGMGGLPSANRFRINPFTAILARSTKQPTTQEEYTAANVAAASELNLIRKRRKLPGTVEGGAWGLRESSVGLKDTLG